MAETVEQVRLSIFKAAARLAQSPVPAKLDEEESTAAACKDLWPSIFQKALQMYEWPWARKRAVLDLDLVPPLGDDWRARHEVPADLLRMRRIVSSGDEAYQRMGSYLLNNYREAIMIEYIAMVDETVTSHVFRRLAQELLAIDLAVTVKQDQRLADRLERSSFLARQAAQHECTNWNDRPGQMTLRAPGVPDTMEQDYNRGRVTS